MKSKTHTDPRLPSLHFDKDTNILNFLEALPYNDIKKNTTIVELIEPQKINFREESKRGKFGKTTSKK